MPGPNAIVGRIDRIDPPLDKTGAAELLRHNPDGVSIYFEAGESVRLLQGHVGPGLLSVLEQLRVLRAPAYVELRPDTREITRLLIPLVSRVAKVDENADGGVQVELEASHARHVLKRESLSYAELLKTLRDAAAQRTPLAVTETDAHEIIDARPWPDDVPGPAQSGGGGKTARGPGLFARIFRWWWWPWCWPFWCCGCISPARAQQLFNIAAAPTCNPLTVPPPCIPFLYPDDGCWARAHEMCRLMIAAGASPKKVWIDGSLHTPTKNNPSCFVDWGWHVAPTLCVRYRWFRCADMVIDPSLFTTPVSQATWKGVQGDPNATLTPTAWTVYWRNVIPTDPAYVDTNNRLAYYRAQLQLRSLQPAGPPPYAFCP
jgi:hypothetical protein